ncbi:uncharacterized protein [Elaeis guineensis]|uniref:uncharacterized protein isoform X2 n=1 Tax=Elaeis guineensis var. tenera TaxID=51953 RepID=UPI003C6D7343
MSSYYINIPVVRAETITLQHFIFDITVVTAGAVSAVSIAVAASMGQPFNTAEDGSCFAGVGTSMARLAWELGDAIDRKFSSLVPDIYVGAS